MFVIFEGPDGSGKSSLVEATQSKLKGDTRRFHMGRPEQLTRRWALSEYAINVERIQVDSATHILADRWHWGEIAYAPIKRPDTDKDGYGILGVAGWRWVELFLASRGAVQFVVIQPIDVLKSRLGTRGDDFVDSAELEGILSRYVSGIKKTGSTTVEINPPDGFDGMDEFVDTLLRIARASTDSVGKLIYFPEYIGPPRPKALLIGDKRNIPDVTILPFMPVDGNSGDYLMSALPESLWRHVGIINAADIHGTRMLELYDVLGRPSIVALGRLAEREVRSSGLYVNEYAVLPHPQYVRRFHHRDKEEYGMAIESFASGTAEDRERYSHWILP